MKNVNDIEISVHASDSMVDRDRNTMMLGARVTACGLECTMHDV